MQRCILAYQTEIFHTVNNQVDLSHLIPKRPLKSMAVPPKFPQQAYLVMTSFFQIQIYISSPISPS